MTSNRKEQERRGGGGTGHVLDAWDRATAREKRKGGGRGGMWGMHGTENCEGEAPRAGRYLLLVVAVGMVVCLAGMLRRLRA